VFFLSQANEELVEKLGTRKTSQQLKEYNKLMETLNDSVALKVILGSTPDFDTEQKTYLNYSTAVEWAKHDWKALFDSIDADEDNWIVVFVARGGFMLLEEIENEIDELTWTYIKPKVQLKTHESDDIFDEFTDEDLVEKLENFAGETLNILFIEDIVEEDEYESNLATALEVLAGKLEDLDIEIGETACLSLITRTSQLAGISVYGLLLSYSGGVETDWGNNMAEGEDYYDFNDILETVIDHDA
jgi:hypothetical protein